MKSKSTSASKKPAVAVPDLKARKNPKGGVISTSRSNIKRPGLAGPGPVQGASISDQAAGGTLTSY